MNDMGGERRAARPIVIITGATGDIGFAICQRLLSQLTHRVPADSLPQKAISKRIRIDEDAQIDFSGLAGDALGLTLILACRNVQRAEKARDELLQLLDEEIARMKEEVRKGKGKQREGELERTVRMRENVVVAVHKLDLASVRSVFDFSREIQQRYPYISHFVCNAGLAQFVGFDWPVAIWQLATHFIAAVTRPLYKLQLKGQLSGDGLGLVWQSNVFGHYLLYRLLDPLLKAYASHSLSSSPARVLWMSSLEADPESYDASDWQLLESTKPYDASKYQMDLLVGHLEKEQARAVSFPGREVPVRHFLFHPGVVRSNIAVSSLNSVVLDYIMQAAFLLAHYLGSTAHVITPYKAAISAVHLILVALPFVTVASSPSASPKAHPHTLANGNGHSTEKAEREKLMDDPVPLKFGSEADFWFREYVGVTEVLEWEDRKEHAAELARKFDSLYEEMVEKDKKEVEAKASDVR